VDDTHDPAGAAREWVVVGADAGGRVPAGGVAEAQRCGSASSSRRASRRAQGSVTSSS